MVVFPGRGRLVLPAVGGAIVPDRPLALGRLRAHSK